jgi:dipeptidyl aminopeptidase/acylaminoacyl peptidase
MLIKPLFVVQGANDVRVTIKEADQIVAALRAKKFYVPYMVKYDEGHGFGRKQIE